MPPPIIAPIMAPMPGRLAGLPPPGAPPIIPAMPVVVEALTQ